MPLILKRDVPDCSQKVKIKDLKRKAVISKLRISKALNVVIGWVPLPASQINSPLAVYPYRRKFTSPQRVIPASRERKHLLVPRLAELCHPSPSSPCSSPTNTIWQWCWLSLEKGGEEKLWAITHPLLCSSGSERLRPVPRPLRSDTLHRYCLVWRYQLQT